MTLPEYFQLTQELSVAIDRFDALESDEQDEIDTLAERLQTACDALEAAKCADAGSSDRRDATRLIHEAKGRLRSVKLHRVVSKAVRPEQIEGRGWKSGRRTDGEG
jgi:hypothetical protein